MQFTTARRVDLTFRLRGAPCTCSYRPLLQAAGTNAPLSSRRKPSQGSRCTAPRDGIRYVNRLGCRRPRGSFEEGYGALAHVATCRQRNLLPLAAPAPPVSPRMLRRPPSPAVVNLGPHSLQSCTLSRRAPRRLVTCARASQVGPATRARRDRREPMVFASGKEIVAMLGGDNQASHLGNTAAVGGDRDVITVYLIQRIVGALAKHWRLGGQLTAEANGSLRGSRLLSRASLNARSGVKNPVNLTVVRIVFVIVGIPRGPSRAFGPPLCPLRCFFQDDLRFKHRNLSAAGSPSAKSSGAPPPSPPSAIASPHTPDDIVSSAEHSPAPRRGWTMPLCNLSTATCSSVAPRRRARLGAAKHRPRRSSWLRKAIADLATTSHFLHREKIRRCRPRAPYAAERGSRMAADTEDHMITARLAVTAAFTRGIPN